MPSSVPDVAAFEAVERDAWLDMFDASPPPFSQGAGLACARFGEAAAFAIRAAPAVQFNRAQGAGLAEASEEVLDGVTEWLAAHCGPAWALQTIEGEGGAPLASRLASKGLIPSGSWTKFVRRTDAPPRAKTDLSIRIVGSEGARDFGSSVQTGFGAPPPFAGWAGALAGRTGWTTYVAYEGETAAAAAAMYLSNGLAWLGLSCCRPEFRGRGAQSVLLSRRLSDAEAAGAPWAVTETGTPPPGEETDHPSYRNILRAGFQPLYRRINYRPVTQLR